MTVKTIDGLIGHGGALLPNGASPRAEQLRMAQTALRAIKDRQQVALDAPTGTGKSFAYATAIVESGRSAIIATPTKALTAQLADKDIPAVAQAAELGFAELLGRNNYTCDASSAPDYGCEATCDDDTYCAYRVAMFNALEAELVVTTLDKLFYMMLRPGRQSAALLDGRVIVIDEADCIDEAATRVFGSDFKAGMFSALVQRLQRMRPEARMRIVCDFEEEAIPGAAALRQKYVDWWTAMTNEYRSQCSNGRSSRPIEMLYERVYDASPYVRRTQEQLYDQARKYAGVLKTEDGTHPIAENAYEQVRQLTPEGSNYLLTLQGEYGGGFDTTVLHKGVIETGRAIKPLLDSVRPLILTSATLAPQHLMNFQVGIEMPIIPFDSPFNLRENRQGYIASEIKPPRGGRMSYQERQQLQGQHTQYVADAVAHCARTYGGRTMALFSSIREMQDCAYRLRSSTDYRVLTQKDELNAQWAVREYIDAGGAECVLLGSASYMRGVDLPGDQLKAVVIAKTPLARYDALGKARLERYRGYLDAVAQRVLNQCAGRLIRAAGDSGMVVLCEGGRFQNLFRAAVTPSPVNPLNIRQQTFSAW